MGRWRDVKKGKIEQNIKEKKPVQENQSSCDATLINRAKAFITDAFMIMMPLMYLVSYIVIGSLAQFAENKSTGWMYILIPHAIITIGFWYLKGQTPGLKAYEISIVDCVTGEKPSIVALINRYVFTTLSIMIFPLLLAPYLNKKRKSFADLLSHTCIKNTPNEVIS